jgi:hypothetical protein
MIQDVTSTNQLHLQICLDGCVRHFLHLVISLQVSVKGTQRDIQFLNNNYKCNRNQITSKMTT